jgi:PAS domain S-box-containing protein
MANQKLLIIDDSPDIQELVMIWLAEEPLEFLSCGTGLDGVKDAARLLPDLILLDVDLPDINGFEVCRRLKIDQTTNPIPVVFLTGASSTEEKLRGLELGAIDYVTKPFDPAELRARVRSALNTRRLMDLLAQKAAVLQESEARFRAMVEGTSVIVWEYDSKKDAFIYVSPQASVLGYPPDQWLNPGFLQSHVHPDDVGSLSFHRSKAAPDAPPPRSQFRFIRADGSARWIEEVVSVESQGEGAQLLRGVMIDVTDRRQLEMQLTQAQRLKSIGQLAAGMAHEINTPIQYVGDNVRFLQLQFNNLLTIVERFSAQLDPAAASIPWSDRQAEMNRICQELDLDFLRREIPPAVAQSLEGLDRVGSIVRTMKEFSHPGSETKEFADLNRSILTTVEVCRNRWKHVAVVETDFAPDLPAVPCLIAAFNQVILNLIVNAADAIGEVVAVPRLGRILIVTRQMGKCVEVRVQDNGPGIPENIRPRIFEPFYTTKTVGKGTGQGLTLSRDIVVNQHAGKLFFESAPGGGTTFVIQLPLLESQESKVIAA